MKDIQVPTVPSRGIPTQPTPALRLLGALADLAATDEFSPAVALLTVQIVDSPSPGIAGVAELSATLAAELARLMDCVAAERSSAGAL